MQAVIYARTSTITQKNNDTVESQVMNLEKYCSEKNINVIDSYIDNESGASEERILNLVKYLSDNSKNINAIVFTYFDRIARDVYLQLFLEKECQKLNIKLISTEQDILNDSKPDPFRKAMKQIISVFAELEKNLITMRLKNGRKHKAVEKGVKSQGSCPLGYQYQGKTTKDKKVVIVTQEAEIIKYIYDFFQKKQNFAKTAKYINGLGYRTRTAREFSRQGIRLILTNEFYTGLVVYNEDKVKGQHEAIISKIQFNRIQKIINKG